jgi:3D (Asp-Asp-Asp) domain-containing protein
LGRAKFLALLAAIAAVLCVLRFGASAQQPKPLTIVVRTIAITADGQSREVRTAADTVGQALDEIGVALSRMDRVSPAPDKAITEGVKIRVERVTRRQETEDVTVEGRTVVLGDPEQPAGYTKILERGGDGLVTRITRVWEKDGQPTKKGVVKEKVIIPARDTVVLRGTRGEPSRGGDYRKPIRMHATAYDPGPRSCGKYASGFTATGVKAKKGVAAVDDRVIPMGTRLYVPGYGFAVAADRGSAIKGHRIDLCFDTYAEAIRWGRRKVQVYVLD